MSLTPSKGHRSWPPHPKTGKQKQQRDGRGPARHSSRLMTCSLRVMMDKDFSRWDEIKIYTRCFRTQLVGRSSSFNSISAAGDGHPESGLSNGAVSWQNLHADTRARTQTHVGERKKKHAFGTSGACRHSWGWTIDAGGRPNHRTKGTENGERSCLGRLHIYQSFSRSLFIFPTPYVYAISETMEMEEKNKPSTLVCALTSLAPRPTFLSLFSSLSRGGNRPQDTSSVSFSGLSAAPNFY